jgi:hypothetical protein
MPKHVEQVEKARVEAVRLFQYYFKTAFQAAGLKWDSDNDTEVRLAVDLIINATVLSALDK